MFRNIYLLLNNYFISSQHYDKSELGLNSVVPKENTVRSEKQKFHQIFCCVQKIILPNFIHIYSKTDIALVIKYVFSSTVFDMPPAAASDSRKRKSIDMKQQEEITQYSNIKLPAQFFIDYLRKYFADFLITCQR